MRFGLDTRMLSLTLITTLLQNCPTGGGIPPKQTTSFARVPFLASDRVYPCVCGFLLYYLISCQRAKWDCMNDLEVPATYINAGLFYDHTACLKPQLEARSTDDPSSLIIACAPATINPTSKDNYPELRHPPSPVVRAAQSTQSTQSTQTT